MDRNVSLENLMKGEGLPLDHKKFDANVSGSLSCRHRDMTSKIPNIFDTGSYQPMVLTLKEFAYVIYITHHVVSVFQYPGTLKRWSMIQSYCCYHWWRLRYSSHWMILWNTHLKLKRRDWIYFAVYHNQAPILYTMTTGIKEKWWWWLWVCDVIYVARWQRNIHNKFPFRLCEEGNSYLHFFIFSLSFRIFVASGSSRFNLAFKLNLYATPSGNMKTLTFAYTFIWMMFANGCCLCSFRFIISQKITVATIGTSIVCTSINKTSGM